MSCRDDKVVVLVTGASTGLGLAVARELLPTEYRLILTAKKSSMPRFAEAGISESDRVWLRVLDVTSDAERRAVVAEATEKWGGVDILVNNAGIAYRAVVEHVSPQAREEIQNINYRGPMDLIRLVLPGMRAKRAGRIINVSSVSGMVAMPTLSLYSASKFALEGASEALWYEVRPFGIHVTLIQPGFIRSESFRNTRYTEASRHSLADVNDPYHIPYTRMEALISRLMHASPNTHANVAHVIVKTMRRRAPPLRIPCTMDAHIFGFIRRLLPRGLYHKLLYRELPGVRDWGRINRDP